MRTPALPLLRSLAAEGQLVHTERLPARPARTADLAAPTRPDVWEAFGIPSMWTHQAAAVDLVRERQSVVVATGTASGKSLCYQLPVAEAVTGSPAGSALLMFPTKALAQDQLRVLAGLGLPGLVAATYDGDTGPEARAWTRRNANVLLTNPEMLHTAILPFHGRWATFLSRLRYVVVDELHVLRGVFGSHVAHLLRRLRRLCARYGAEPTFVFSSATIGEPARLASALCGLPVTAVTDDGSPRGERLVALWNPPLLDEDTGVRVGSNTETGRVAAGLVEGGWTTVAFCRSRRGTEVVAGDLRKRLPERAGRVRSYRAGYLATERREIEAELFSGRLDAVVATSALELGIDVGGLDAVVLNGFPGTIASMWQQVGRAGRGLEDSVAVLVAGTDQLDQWLMTHPVEVFTRPPEQAVVNPGNPSVLDPQLGCAAYEQPLVPGDEVFWGEQLEDGVRRLVIDDHLRLREGRAYWHGRGSPAPGISLRSGGGGDEYRIVDVDDRLVGTVDPSRAFEQVHPGAIYLHLGQQYRVTELDLHDRVAVVEAVEVDEYTQTRSRMDVAILGAEQQSWIGTARLHLGPVEISTQVTGYERRDSRSREVIERVELELPPSQLVTRGFWYTVDERVLGRARIEPEQLPGTLHAAEHAGIGILPLFAICDRWDVGGVSTAFQADTGLPTIVVYDGYPGGVGIAELGFSAGRRHLEATRAVIERCRCRSGCPSCVQSPKCGNGNEPLDKAGALALLRTVLAG